MTGSSSNSSLNIDIKVINGQANNALKNFGQIVNTTVVQINNNFNNVSKTINKTNNDFRQFNNTVNNVGNSLNNQSKSISGFNASLLGLSATFGIISNQLKQLSGNISNTAAEYDKELRNVNSLAQVSESRFSMLGDQVRALTQDPKTKEGAVGLAKALYTLTGSGFDVSESLKIAGFASKAAAAGMTDTATAVYGLSVLQSAYNEKTLADTIRYSDDLFKVVDKGVNVSFEKLTQNLGTVIAQATAAGVSFKEVGAAFIALSKSGVNVSESETSIANLIRSIVDPSEEAIKLATKYKFELSAAALEAKGLTGIVQDLNKAAKGDVGLMSKFIPEARAARGALTLARDGARDFNQALNDMANSAGSTERALSQQSKAFTFGIDKMKQALEDLRIEYGLILNKAMTPFIDTGNDIIKFFKNLDDGTKENIVKVGVFATAITGLGAAIGVLSFALSPVVKMFVSLGGIIARGGALISAFATEVRILASVIGTLGASIAVLLSTTGIGALLIAIPSVILLLQSWDSWVKLLTNSNNGLLNSLGQVMDKINILGKAKEYLNNRSLLAEQEQQAKATAKEIDNAKKRLSEYRSLSESEKTPAKKKEAVSDLLTLSGGATNPEAQKRLVEEARNLKQQIVVTEALAQAEKNRNEAKAKADKENVRNLQKQQNAEEEAKKAAQEAEKAQREKEEALKEQYNTQLKLLDIEQKKIDINEGLTEAQKEQKTIDILKKKQAVYNSMAKDSKFVLDKNIGMDSLSSSLDISKQLIDIKQKNADEQKRINKELLENIKNDLDSKIDLLEQEQKKELERQQLVLQTEQTTNFMLFSQQKELAEKEGKLQEERVQNEENASEKIALIRKQTSEKIRQINEAELDSIISNINSPELSEAYNKIERISQQTIGAVNGDIGSMIGLIKTVGEELVNFTKGFSKSIQEMFKDSTGEKFAENYISMLKSTPIIGEFIASIAQGVTDLTGQTISDSTKELVKGIKESLKTADKTIKEYYKARDKAEKELSEDIQKINKEKYQTEIEANKDFFDEQIKQRKDYLKLIGKLNHEELKSQIEDELKQIKGLEEKRKDLLEGRITDQKKAQENAAKFATALGALKMNAGLRESALSDFGAKSEGQETNLESQLQTGQVSITEYRAKRAELSLQKYAYLQNELNKTLDPEEKIKTQKEMMSLQKDYFEFSHDSELEEIDLQKEKAENKKKDLENQLSQEIDTINQIESARLTAENNIKNAYMSGANTFKDVYVNAVYQWEQAGIKAGFNIGSSVMNSLNEAQNKINALNQQQAEAVSKAVSSGVINKNTGAAMGSLLGSSIGSNVTASMGSKMGSLLGGVSNPVNNVLAGLSAVSSKFKAFANGGVIDKPTFALMGEKGREYVFNEQQMNKLQYAGGGGINFAPTIVINGGNGQDMARLVRGEINNVANDFRRIVQGRR